MSRQCEYITPKGTRCKHKIPEGETQLCTRHHNNKCLVCFEVMNDGSKKELTCKHTFHTSCIMQWYAESGTCPICRVEQSDDPLLQFKDVVEENLRMKYKDAIQSMEQEIQELKEYIAMWSPRVSPSA